MAAVGDGGEPVWVQHSADLMETIGAIGDPVRRARASNEAVNAFQRFVEQGARIRREAVDELIARGLTYGQIGSLIGVSAARVGQVRTSQKAVVDARKAEVAAYIASSEKDQTQAPDGGGPRGAVPPGRAVIR